MRIKHSFLALSLILATLFFFRNHTSTANALTVRPATVIDDFEDGDAGDWIFFGGNAAGGGGGALADRPQEGGFYLSTGWGGNGTASSFYGGFFRNFADTSQIVPPPDPWFNVWVLNQSDATVDQYTLEITLREDLDGNGWTDGAEDSIRLDTVFVNTPFDDQWTLLSAPLSAFANMGTGGNGAFDGSLDEVVMVIAGVEGAAGSVVEVDFDQFAFSSGGPLVESLTVFDDMEHGNPFANGYFSFGGSVGGGGIGPNDADLPPSDGGAFSLQTGWGSGGVAGFLGGFGRTSPTDLTDTTHFNLWINPDAGQDFLMEINLQEDDNGDNAANAPDDDEFQYNCVISPVGPCAISGGGWQQISIPLDEFFDDNSFFTGGNGVLDAASAASGGNGQLINVVMAIITNSGADATFRTDYWAFSDGALSIPSQLVDDFENGLPSGSDEDGVPVGFFTFSDGSPIAIATTDAPPAPVPGSAAGNNVLAMTGDVAAFAGFIHGFENEDATVWVPQDWSSFEGLSFWLYGQSTGTTLFVDVIDNRNEGSTSDDAERFTVSLIDDFSGWQQFEFPFASFVRKEIGNGAPNDGFTLTQVHGWALGTLNTPGEVTYYIDDAYLYGEAQIPELNVTFTSARYEIEEGTSGEVTVKLNRPMNSDDPAQVSVDYFTAPGVATPGREYTPVAGTLTFVNGGPSELSFTIETFDDTKWEGDERIALGLTNPVDVATGFATTATALIIENDPFDANLINDFTHGAFLLKGNGVTALETIETVAGASNAIPGQDAYETILQVTPVSGISPRALIAQARDDAAALLPTGNAYADAKIGQAVAGLDEVLNPANWENDYYLVADTGKSVMHDLKWAVIRLGIATPKVPALADAISDIGLSLVGASHNLAQIVLDMAITSGGTAEMIGYAEQAMLTAESALANELYFVALSQYRIAWDQANKALAGVAPAPLAFDHDFALGEDWSGGQALTFWYYGQNSGEEVTVHLKDNRAPDPGPAGWNMVWSEEFNEPAGTPPNPETGPMKSATPPLTVLTAGAMMSANITRMIQPTRLPTATATWS